MSVSVVGMGCNQLGVSCDRDGAVALVDEAVAAGINYFDIADEYGRRYWDPTDPTWGLAEELLGRALRGKREKVVVATKFGVRPPTTARSSVVRARPGSPRPSKTVSGVSTPTTSICTSFTSPTRLCPSPRHWGRWTS